MAEILFSDGLPVFAARVRAIRRKRRLLLIVCALIAMLIFNLAMNRGHLHFDLTFVFAGAIIFACAILWSLVNGRPTSAVMNAFIEASGFREVDPRHAIHVDPLGEWLGVESPMRVLFSGTVTRAISGNVNRVPVWVLIHRNIGSRRSDVNYTLSVTVQAAAELPRFELRRRDRLGEWIGRKFGYRYGYLSGTAAQHRFSSKYCLRSPDMKEAMPLFTDPVATWFAEHTRLAVVSTEGWIVISRESGPLYTHDASRLYELVINALAIRDLFGAVVPNTTLPSVGSV